MKNSSCNSKCLPTLEEVPSRLVSGNVEQVIAASPLISIVIPTFMRPNLLRQTLDSVLRQPGIDNVEVVITDNNPDDDETSAMMQKEYKRDNILYYKNSQNIDGAGNWNRMVMLSHGEWCVMLHDDDMMLPERLPLFFKIVRQLPDADLIGFPAVDFHGKEPFASEVSLPSRVKVWPLSMRDQVRRNYISPCCTLFKREHWIELGGLDISGRYKPCDDYFLWMRFIEKYHSAWLCNANVGAYRWLDNDSLNPKTIKSVIARNFEIQAAYIKGRSYWQFIDTVCLSYEYLRKRLRQINLGNQEISELYKANGLRELSFMERILTFFWKNAIRMRQEIFPRKGQRFIR